ncbi:aminoglycoside N(3)-acetyltransferase [Streptomyces sp. MBT62]|uniref:aminoglycoside N(3)-acetyltransferase n=1 Tax=Streptomyces sp. MBT62 TaxID=2800410 RepID=UPI00190A5C9B|nr:AAC(3) family N-acetyltransferase [Streptomyces sp. MBT62]MBK3569598.1 AAC(3) family N-acetyltransferase [Streptomyces sp. MBT62]
MVTDTGPRHRVRGLVEDLRALGLAPGHTVLAHTSLRAVGPTQGGAGGLLWALREAVTPAGTVVVPTHTTDNSLTSRAYRERVAGFTPAQKAAHHAAMPGFDADTTPSTGMGQLAERLRLTPGARRSAHPQTSFAALGPMAEWLTLGHVLDCHLGERSPLGRLYRASAYVLLLGVGYDKCTALHLAEYRLPDTRRQEYACAVATPDGTVWRSFTDIPLHDGDFALLGADLDEVEGAYGPLVRHGQVGSATARFLPMVPAVDFAFQWFGEHRRC